ncbi:MAG TPA: M23 family metallopeptidase [Oscillospiraceae bacterium]|nr:M23 family metallopeptidase [Oscillospiraceae bacterium]
MRRIFLAAMIGTLFFTGCAAGETAYSQPGSVEILPASVFSQPESNSTKASSEPEIQSQKLESVRTESQSVSSAASSSVCLTVSSDRIRPGEFLIVRVENSEENALWARFSKVTTKIFPLIKEDGYFIGFVPLSSTTSKTGKVQILRSESGEYRIVAEKTITFVEKAFERQDLTVVSGSSTANAGSSDNLSDDKKVIEKATETSVRELLFSGEFVMPVEGRISTQYGMRRYTNGVYSSAHSGYDIAADEGDPVIAAGAGRIVYSGNLKFYGNTVIIAHGFNIFSYYNHLSVISVETGQTVSTGEKIGEVGSTGYATGPHLHFNIQVNGVNIDPAVLIGTDDIYTQLERMINQ